MLSQIILLEFNFQLYHLTSCVTLGKLFNLSVLSFLNYKIDINCTTSQDINETVRAKLLQLCPTLWTPLTVALQAPLSMGFFRQEYQSGLPFPPPGNLPNLGIEPVSPVFPALQADSSPAQPPGKPKLKNLMLQNPGITVVLCCAQSLSCVRLFVTPQTVACQAPLSMGFSRQEYWSEESSPFPGDLPYPGIKPKCPALQADSLPFEPPGKPVAF